MSKQLTINILAGILIFYPTISWGVLYHTVSGDETLWRISKKYGMSVEELQQINGLNGNLICKGQQLIISKNTECGMRNAEDRKKKVEGRSKKQEVRSQNVKVEKQEIGIVQETTSTLQKSYVVKKGDTLFSIARRNSCTVHELKRLNHLSDNTIEVNQVLSLDNSMPCQRATPQVTNGQSLPSDDAHLPDVFAASEGAPLAEEAPSAEEASLSKGASPMVEASSKVKENLDTIDSDTIADIRFSENPSAIASQIVDTAKRYLYLPYKSGGEIGDEATDCSGFVKRTFGYFGIKLPRSAREQWKEGFSVTELHEGDLVFFATYASYPSHVGIYIGGDRFIHSSSYRSGGVRIDSMDSPYYHQRYLGARRVVALE